MDVRGRTRCRTADPAILAGISRDAGQPQFRGGDRKNRFTKRYRVSLHLPVGRPLVRGGLSAHRRRISELLERSGRLRGGPRCGRSPRDGRGMEGGGTALGAKLMKNDARPTHPSRWGEDTKLVRGGLDRSPHGETSEALFLNSGFVYDEPETAER